MRNDDSHPRRKLRRPELSPGQVERREQGKELLGGVQRGVPVHICEASGDGPMPRATGEKRRFRAR